MVQLAFDARTVKPYNPPTDIEDQPRDTSRKWSHLQQNIFDFVEHGQGNAIVEAVAGSGKTTTIVEALKRVRGTSIFLAFNKSISEELKARGVNARTFHSLTYGPVTQARDTRTVEMDKLRRLCDAKLKGEDAAIYGAFICKLVGLGRQVGIGCLVPDLPQTWMDICIHHDAHQTNDPIQRVKINLRSLLRRVLDPSYNLAQQRNGERNDNHHSRHRSPPYCPHTEPHLCNR